MTVEIELKKMLEEAGYESKNTAKHAVWTLEHKKYGIVNFHKYKDTLENRHKARTISFNYLGTYMRYEARELNSNLKAMDKEERRLLYHRVLSKLKFYEKIKDNLFINNKDNQTHYVHISEEIEISIFAEIIQSIVNGDVDDDIQPRKNMSITKSDMYIPTEDDYEHALRQLGTPGEDIPISKVEDYIEDDMEERKVILKPGWRSTIRKPNDEKD